MSNRRHLARRRAIALAGVAAASLSPSIVGSRVAGAALPTIYDQNICGAAGCGFQGWTGVLDPIKFMINLQPSGSDTGPIGLQESCTSQFNDMKNWLRANRTTKYYGNHYSQNSTTACGPGVNDYGVSAFAIASSYNPFDNAANNAKGPLSPQVPGDEARGYACITGGLSSPKYWSCSAHLSPYNTTTAGKQFNAYYSQVVAPRASTLPVLWGGDFYVSPNDLPLVSPTFSFATSREADLCLPGTNTYRWTFRNTANGDLRKFDYAFRSLSMATCSQDADLVPANPTDMYNVGSFPSDHRLVLGYQ